jgi:hypothetical protein
MRDLAWIMQADRESLERFLDGEPIYDPVEKIVDEVQAVHERMEKAARQISSLWRYIIIDPEGNVKKHPIMAQDDIFRMFPEINPRWFENFGVVELTIRQKNGDQIKLMKVR